MKLNTHRSLPVLPVFKEKKVKWVRRKLDQAKNRIKKTNGTNIIATNFVWEQLIIKNPKNLQITYKLYAHYLDEL